MLLSTIVHRHSLSLVGAGKVLLGVTTKTQGASAGRLTGRTGVSRRSSSHLYFRRERGTRNPSVQRTEELARALEISVSMLVEQAGMEVLLVKTTRATSISSPEQETTTDNPLPLLLRREWAGRIGDKCQMAIKKYE